MHAQVKVSVAIILITIAPEVSGMYFFQSWMINKITQNSHKFWITHKFLVNQMSNSMLYCNSQDKYMLTPGMCGTLYELSQQN